jgi:DNA-nicking Smr family endonuclease
VEAQHKTDFAVPWTRERRTSSYRKSMDTKLSLIDAVLPLTDTRKRQMRRIVPRFLANCRSNRIYEARIVHGTTDARTERALHEVLKSLPEVACFRTGGPQAGSPRATVVVLLGPDEMPPAGV